MAILAIAGKQKSVADPNHAYESVKKTWSKNRAICSGESATKDYDGVLDTRTFSNLLIPFSPSMNPQQYAFYKAEAELPGIVSLYVKFLVGGLLRKQPQFGLPDNFPAELKELATNWILQEFTQDSLQISSFIYESLMEEIQTARAWLYIDYPSVTNTENLSREDFLKLKPYPVLWKAENVINWQTSKDPLTGQTVLSKVILRGYEESFEDNEFHPEYRDTVYVHEVIEGYYQIRKFQNRDTNKAPVMVQGVQQPQHSTGSASFVEVEVNQNILMNGERLTFIPAWPLNGSIDIQEPFITALVDREIALYNKVSRRNHLLYGASTYTPVISSDMGDAEFEEIVSGGLGTWLHLRQGDSASVLETPTHALADMEVAIAKTVEEMAKMGVRMLAPESAESGIALEIRNAAQTATLGVLNTKVSGVMRDALAFMLNWRYDLELTGSDIDFTLSADFNPSPLGADWLRLVTEWYQQGLLPRSVWLQILKQNDIVPSEYDDENAIQEINGDEFIVPSSKEQEIFKESKRVSQDLKSQIDED
jgi:hypothetical protein